MLILGPGGAFAPDPAAARHLLVGDESALPAIAASLERLPDAAVGQALIEVDGARQEQTLAAPSGVEIRWIHRDGRRLGEALVDAVGALDLTDAVDGNVQAFVHGEAGVVKDLRRLFTRERGFPRASLSISGYWRQGQDDEAWRAVKAAWNREIEESEQAG
jgi:NADPH-dependent ferric siderophore reductase